MTKPELPPAIEAQKQAELAKVGKIHHARQFVEEKLLLDDGPKPGTSAVMVIRALPANPDDPTDLSLFISCLPDIDHGAMADALERWAHDIREGNYGQPTEDEGDGATKQ